MLIVALDCPNQSMALNLVDALGDEVLFYKVGWRLFLQGGLALVGELRNMGKDVFLDLKMDDIEETIEKAVGVIGDEAMFLTIQGFPATVRAAARGRQGRSHPKLLYVPLVSSLGPEDVRDQFSIVPGADSPHL
jgi:orotidine-5'-phosphate decarboxylase